MKNVEKCIKISLKSVGEMIRLHKELYFNWYAVVNGVIFLLHNAAITTKTCFFNLQMKIPMKKIKKVNARNRIN